MIPVRAIRLIIHPGKHSTSWMLVHRTDDGRTVFDRRLHAGTLSHIGVLKGVGDISLSLRHIADEIDRRHGIAPPAEPARESRGTVEGGSAHRPGRVCADHCPLCGEHLDGMPSSD